MRILLDTHAFLWWVDDAPALSAKARETIAAAGECWVSLASAWEIAIKTRLGKLRLAVPVRRFVPEHIAADRFRQLEIAFAHIARVETLDLHHRDPFDRLLVAQAMEEGLAIVSVDAVFGAYGVERIW
jgi:PIN domain nuclease of toxin-antitoxin system